MATYYEQAEREDEEPETGGWWRRLKDRWAGEPEDEEDEEPRAGAARVAPFPGAATATSQTPRRSETLRIATNREGSITVMPVNSFTDIQRAADRLKAGEPQIINLERTPAEVSERLIDFLNGVTYALDGSVEKIAEGAYLFTPSHIAIHAASSGASDPKPFFDR